MWVVDGGGLHEMEFCSPRRHTLPQIVLSNFASSMLKQNIVWQPVTASEPSYLLLMLLRSDICMSALQVGGGFLMRSSKRFNGDCALIDADQVPVYMWAPH